MKKTIAIAFLALSLAATPASAGMSCGGGFISVGDSAYKVLKRCGKPHYKTVSKIGLSSRQEVWHYHFSNRLAHTIIIRDGEVIKIKVD